MILSCNFKYIFQAIEKETSFGQASTILSPAGKSIGKDTRQVTNDMIKYLWWGFFISFP